MPPQLDEETEIAMQQLKNKLERCTVKYLENPRRKRNLTQQQEEGLTSLVNRRKEQEIIILETDKSKQFSCDTPDNYRLMAETHTDKDETTDMRKKQEFEKLVNAHTEMWVRVLNAGKSVNHHDRIRSSMISKNCPPAPLSLLRKDHKECESQIIGPPGGPVCGGDVSYNKRLSHMLSTMLTEIYREEPSVCTSTEGLIAEIDRINNEGINVSYILGSADVDALYPSLDVPFTVDKVCDMFNESDVTYENINYNELGLYIALNKTQEEIEDLGLSDMCPKRRSRRGPRPNVTGCGCIVNENERYKPWILANIANINDVDKRKMLTE